MYANEISHEIPIHRIRSMSRTTAFEGSCYLSQLFGISISILGVVRHLNLKKNRLRRPLIQRPLLFDSSMRSDNSSGTSLTLRKRNSHPLGPWLVIQLVSGDHTPRHVHLRSEERELCAPFGGQKESCRQGESTRARRNRTWPSSHCFQFQWIF